MASVALLLALVAMVMAVFVLMPELLPGRVAAAGMRAELHRYRRLGVAGLCSSLGPAGNIASGRQGHLTRKLFYEQRL